MKLEYTTPEIEVTLFATESIMGDSDVASGMTTEEIPGSISADIWLD